MYVPDESASPALRELRRHACELRLAAGVADLCYWDERTNLAAGGAAWRAEQRSWIAGIVHECQVAPALERAIAAVEEQDSSDHEARVMRRDLDRQRALSTEFVRERASAVSAARDAWERARLVDSFTPFSPHLERLVDLARREADAYGFEDEPYDALLEVWEPGMRAAALAGMFGELETALRPLVSTAREPGTIALNNHPIADDDRWAFESMALAALGFDRDRGRVDTTSRAFCIRLAPDDVRMTTRFHATKSLRSFGSTLHEAGHAIYAQSFARLGVPETLAMHASVGVDESQSRMLEVFVGGGEPFWQAHLPQLAAQVGGPFTAATTTQIVDELRRAEGPHQRIGSDEISYNMHVLVRFELERALVNGALAARDVPEAWDSRMAELFGTRPASPADGCLQDVHWSIGQWGYFPTYMLGNVYAAQLLEAARRDLPNFDHDLAMTGSTSQLVSWLDEHLYRFGRMRDGAAAIEHATQQKPSVAPLIRHLRSRYAAMGVAVS